MPLSDAWLKANNGKVRAQTEVKSDRDGLGARVTPKGKIIFQMRYRYHGKAVRLDLGSYPLIGLKVARAECHRLRAELEAGHDPKVVLALEKQAIQQAATFRELFDHWYENYCRKNKVSHGEILGSFKLHVLPRLGHLPADRISLHEWLDLLEPMAESTPAIASRVLSNTKQLYKWGVKRRLVPHNPLADITGFEDLRITKKPKERTLTDEEIRYLWMALEGSRMSPRNKIFLKLCLVYGCRCGELRVAEREHIDFKEGVWTVPPENHKMGKKTGKPLKRPIIPATEHLFRDVILLCGNSRYLLPLERARKKDQDQPVGDRSHLSLPYGIQDWLKKRHNYTMAHWSLHDLRRTARTNFSTLTEPHVAEIMLGHKLPGQWQVYDQHDYLKEQALAYEKWWERIMGIVG